MKKLHLLAAAAMVFAMTACSQEEPIGPEENGPGSETVMDTDGKYMAISISNAADSRAASDFEFIDGEDYENYIDAEKIRFYFFDHEGNPFLMTGKKNINGEDIVDNMIKPLNITANNVENSPASVANAVLVLGKAAGQGYEGTMPSRIVCVANADENKLKEYANKSLSELEKVMHDAVTPGAQGTFVMTSSAYWDNGKVFWSEIKGDNIASTTADAATNPVQIYIERLAARVEVVAMPESAKVLDADGNALVIDYMDWQDNKLVKVEGKSVIAVPTGWGINTAAKKSYGIKNVANFSDDPADTHYFTNLSDWTHGVRSYWSQTTATDYTAEALKPERFVPSELTYAVSTQQKPVYKYIFGNTADPFLQGVRGFGIDSFRGKKNFARTYATKVLVGVKLYVVDKDATTYNEEDAINLMYWGGIYYTPEAMAHSIAEWEPTDMKVICVRGKGTGDKNKLDKQQHFNVNFYKVALDSDYKWGQLVPFSDDETPSANAISMEPAQYWNGMGYYILNISNNMVATNKSNQEMYGVMRNTVYQYKLTSFTGLGTPVTDPDAETDVENPASGETFVAAQLNVLKWRVVSHSVGLE